MRKVKKIEIKSIQGESPLHEADQEIMEQIDKRNDENQALKKLLENLNSSMPKPGSKSSKS